ncbi:SirB2 family protein [Paucibacter sp. R3-3]|uniref:SirB2 family protein n=1 Tax=Roseateles agri TaxID=3098619 RepID=A0ABU5DPT5_9BURK|nr:SirB2 family protein [Paucibacter sp. R3-3]MDY0748337.1 SirB2 family protein [Paucibacter sp. R3-3]
MPLPESLGAYAAVKLVHQSAVALSITGFFVRGAASLAGARWVQGRVAKTLPHVVDSVLLLSALTLLWMLRLTPDRAPWLIAKLIGLVLYIGLGVVALRPGRPPALRAAAWLAALVVAGWIVSVAVTKSPLGFLS